MFTVLVGRETNVCINTYRHFSISSFCSKFEQLTLWCISSANAGVLTTFSNTSCWKQKILLHKSRFLQGGVSDTILFSYKTHSCL